MVNRDEIETINVSVFFEKEVPIEYFDNHFCRFKDWNSSKRELKINSILNPELKIKFEIGSIKTTSQAILGYFGKKDLKTHSLTTLCFIVESMIFIMKNSLIESIELKIKPINKENNDLIRELQNQKALIVKIDGSDQYFENFYIDTPNLAA